MDEGRKGTSRAPPSAPSNALWLLLDLRDDAATMVRLTTLALLLSSAAIPALAVPARLSSSDFDFDQAVANLTSSTLVERGEIEARAVSVQTKCKKSGQFALTFDDGRAFTPSPSS